VVRATNIFRKGGLDADEFERGLGQSSAAMFSAYFKGDGGDAFWELWLAASKTSQIVDQCIATTEPAYLAKHVFHLAQLFNTFYHRHPILSESDEQKKYFLLSTAAVVRRELVRALTVLGIAVPSVM
jgi:arginyl-tRNA synthetase